MDESIAILWDIENVTPSTNSLFVNGLLEYAQQIGRISVARAYGDWTRGNIKQTADVLADHSFEMIHVPRSTKNSADVTLSTQAVELVHQFPHIRKMVLVTGDADFRPLLQSVRKHNIESIVICDAKSASEDLLLLADSYRDFRELIPDSQLSDSDDDSTGEAAISYQDSLGLLREAVAYIKRNNRTPSLGAVKVRMKLLNENFNEEKLGYRSWKKFVLQAQKDHAVVTMMKNQDLILDLPADGSGTEIPMILAQFIKVVKDLRDQHRSSRGGWTPLGTISNALRDRKIDYKSHGFSRLKKLLEAAEKRNLIETKIDGTNQDVRLSKEGENCTVP